MTSCGVEGTPSAHERRHVLGIYYPTRANTLTGTFSGPNLGAIDARSCAGTADPTIFSTHSTVKYKRPFTLALLLGPTNYPN
jgi:hypothetical protein